MAMSRSGPSAAVCTDTDALGTFRNELPDVEMGYFVGDKQEASRNEAMLPPSTSKNILTRPAGAIAENRSAINPANPTIAPMETEPIIERGPITALNDSAGRQASGPFKSKEDDAKAPAVKSGATHEDLRSDNEVTVMKPSGKSLAKQQDSQLVLSTTSSKSSAKEIPRESQHEEDNEDDGMSKTSGCTLDVYGKTDELVLAATQELKMQHDLLQKSKEEFATMNEKALLECKEEYAKLETLQKSMDAKFGTLQTSMDGFSTKIASSVHGHELSIRTLANQSMNGLRQEGNRAVDGVQSQVRAITKVQLPADIRALVEAEARKYAMEMMNSIMAEAKGDFTEWVDGVKKISGVISDGSKSVAGGCNAAGSQNSISGGSETSVGSLSESKATMNTGSLVSGSSDSEKENVKPNYNDKVPLKPALTSKDRNPLGRSRKENENISVHSGATDNSSSTPVHRGCMSTSTTPFSRKATPIQSNFAKNRLPAQYSDRSQHKIDLESELHNDFSVVKSPFSSSRKGSHQGGQTDTNKTTKCASTLVINAKAKANDNAGKKAKATAKSVSSDAAKKSIKRLNTNPAKPTRVKEDDAAIKGKPRPADRTLCVAKQNIVRDKRPTNKRSDHISKRCNSRAALSKKAARKRIQSANFAAAKSPRRSKRLKEGNRVEQMTVMADASVVNAEVTMAKPNKVTPKETGNGIDNASHAHSSVICQSTSGLVANEEKSGDQTVSSVLNGYDSLLGTSVNVPSDEKRDDDLIGLEETEDVADKRSLSSLLPFGGFKSRSFGGHTKSKTMSKKKKSKKKKKSSAFDFEWTF